MGAPKGNSYWKLRRDMSEDGKTLSVDDIYKKAQEYIDRCYNDKLIEIDYRGKFNEQIEIPKMIAMSIYGLCFYLGISIETWRKWRSDEKYVGVVTHVEQLMKSYNIEGSAAGFLNPNIIARLEGLRDEQVHELKGEVKTNIISFGGKEVEI